MPDPIETMKRHRPRQAELGRHLQQQRPLGEAGGQGRGAEVPAEERGGEVGGAEDVEAAGEDGAGYAVEYRGDLWWGEGASVGRLRVCGFGFGFDGWGNSRAYSPMLFVVCRSIDAGRRGGGGVGFRGF